MVDFSSLRPQAEEHADQVDQGAEKLKDFLPGGDEPTTPADGQ